MTKVRERMKYTGRWTTLLFALTAYSPWFVYRYATGELELAHFVAAIVTMGASWWLGGYYDKAKYYSVKDFLTGVYNRNFIYEIFPKLRSQVDRKNARLTVSIIDVDDFKKINDALGHKEGDLALTALSALLVNNTRVGDTVARWGGDEFIVLAPYADSQFVRAFIQRLEMQFESMPVRMQISVGTAIYPDDATELEELVKIADHNMYQIKHTKKDEAVI
jgi:diguanylate cyclase (GGDEF)-like protein